VCASLVHKPWESIKANESWIDESKSRGKNEVNRRGGMRKLNFTWVGDSANGYTSAEQNPNACDCGPN
jgi:hypothetical protein